MNILLWIPGLSQRNGGIRQYVGALLSILKTDIENHYFIHYDISDQNLRELVNEIPKHSHVQGGEISDKPNRVIDFGMRIVNFGGRVLGLKKTIKSRNRLAQYCSRHRIDILHCPFQFLPHVDGIKLITTLHDVQEIHFPEFFNADERAYRATAFLDILRRANLVIVSYAHVKSDIVKYFQIPTEKICIILLRMDHLWFTKYEKDSASWLSTSGSSGNYLLYPANAWPHKNHVGLLEAIASLRDAGKKIPLKCTGDFENEHGKMLIKLRDDLQLQDLVDFLGIVEEKELYALYKSARAVVIPTLYEAGSFPLIESLFLNVPVICSNVTSLPETIGDRQFVFDPESEKSMMTAMEKIYFDDGFRSESVSNGALQKERLKNTAAFENIMLAYKSVLSNN